jgi:hypothetical protein
MEGNISSENKADVESFRASEEAKPPASRRVNFFKLSLYNNP